MNAMSRRAALSAPAALLLATSAAACAEERTATASRTLVAYFSRSGNTRVIAGQLHRELRADLFEILPATPYPEDYEQTVEQARQERDAGVRPSLKASVPNIAAYDTVFLCFPIWGETAPPIIRSFLAAHDLAGKTISPVITHGGYGLGDSLAVLKSHAPSARLEPAFSMEADQERRTMTQVREWLGAIARA
ncbi:flavodoxin [Caulobacter vibrioides]|uniref:Flavodoxin n=2 Tax=Caulobacter vibrioides TaxID=155892 RepID=A0A290MJH6_CAUVI|nr:flavodoxin [Caulobacter vibrioides]